MKVLNYSGGKDSTALLLMLYDNYDLPDKIVFADTLLEFPEMYEFLNKVERTLNIKIERTKPRYTWDEWFYRPWSKGKFQGQIHGFPFVIGQCWHKRHAKQIPLDKINKKADVVYVGYNASEPKRIIKDPKFQYPLRELNMTADDCFAICRKHKLLNPLYDMDFTRLGCWLCQKQSLKSLKVLKNRYPDLFKKLKEYEKVSPHGFKPNFKLEYF